MRLNVKFMHLLFIGAALALAASPCALAAGQIEITTYYDAPFGDFRELDVTGSSTIGSTAGSVVTFAEGGNSSRIGVNVGGASARPFTLSGNANNLVTASFMNNDRVGVVIGAPLGANYGVIAGKAANGAELPLYINAAGGAVSIGDGTLAVGSQLQISGQNMAGQEGRLGVTQAGQTGEVMVAWASGGGTSGYYATYAP